MLSPVGLSVCPPVCPSDGGIIEQEAKLSLGLPTVLPKIVGVMWPRPRPLSGKIICAPARHFRYKDAYQIWSL